MTDPQETKRPTEEESLEQTDDKKGTGDQAEEWGERTETGKSIARGGKKKGPVPGGPEDDTKSVDSDNE